MEDCSICCEHYNKNTRRKVECNYCQHTCCTDCVKKYLLGSHQDAHCMNCKNEWSNDFLDSVLQKTFRLTILKKHRENVLLEREKAMLPATQDVAQRILTCEQLMQENKALTQKKREIESQIRENNHTFWRIKSNQDKPNETKTVYIKACPSNDCRGFLNENWGCGICNSKVCKKCCELIDPTKETHQCNPQTVETIKLLANDSRQCPNCPAMIFKIGGCDQMFCTQCHTAFSFKTGRVETGVIHNPHFYEWQRQQNGGVVPRNPGDIPCGGLPDSRQVIRHLKTICTQDEQKVLCDLHRGLLHVQVVEMPYYAIRPNNIHSNEDLRVAYLLNKVTEQKWKSKLQQREKNRLKCRAIHQVLEVMILAGSEIFRKILENKNTVNFTEVVTEMDAIRVYCNEHLVKISQRFNCVVPTISKDRFLVVKHRTAKQRASDE